jgi:hypothetical protein
LLPALSAAAENCPKPSEQLLAFYTITTTTEQDRKQAKEQKQELVVIRHGSRVAHEYKDKAISEVWGKAVKQRYRLVRYFDQHQRAIEYASADIPNIQGDEFWQQKNQLITDARLAELGQPTLSGSACAELASYQKTKAGSNVEVSYLMQEKLLKFYQQKNAAVTVSWQLDKLLKDEEQVKQWFAKREAYQATDYSDIGDNESDPFLTKMINLGFIEHGSSGMYRADGKAIASEHQHHHH